MKKKIQKPFDAEAAKRGATVETRSGRSVRIICYNKKGSYPIVALVAYGDDETYFNYNVEGKYIRDRCSDDDLVIVEKVGCPKFNVGDWIVREYKNPWLITTVTSDYYEAQDVRGYKAHLYHSLADNSYHLWTIADAKDGDVLATEDWVFIFEKMNSNGKPVCHCHYDIELGFRIDANSYIAAGSEIYPATKDQRDTLEKAMADAGYAFDFEKKDLKKVEDKNPLLSDFFKAEYERGKADAQKLAEWSEEDEKMFRGVIAICDIWSTKNYFYPKENDDIEKLKKWLKSLKDKAQSNQGEMSKMCPTSVQDKL